MRSKEEKQAYFKSLRANWQSAKSKLGADEISEIDAIIKTHGMNISRIGFMVVSMQMRSQGLEGLPYLDAKTFQGWRENGFMVRKGQKSTLNGITWIGCIKKDDQGRVEKEAGDLFSYMIPKGYHLFHRSQVDVA